MPKERIKGSRFTIVHCKGALDSFNDALQSVDSRKRKAFTRGMIQQIQRLADGHRMSKENFPQEGELPARRDQRKTKKFNALKRIPIRGYCWLSERYRNTYFISHYVYKDYGKLKEKDTKRVGDNWKRIEEKGDDC
jgi:hypothetical protein